ncbi:M48 family metalloprotease [Cellvibrio sp.]|uniref:M48 family metalloprotease n=1 Tax=Cellvibrio sp. TaxID=1965322 RepID=UPI00396481CD
MKHLIRLSAGALLAMSLAGCAVNPVTGKQEMIFDSVAQDIATGTQNYVPSQQSQGGQYVVDPGLTAYVNQVGKKLAAVSDMPNLPYEFVVLNNDVPNAWAMPGGKLAINRGLIVQLEDEAQLAAVLGHEIVHAAARHGASAKSQQMVVGAGALLAGVAIANKKPEYGALAVGALAVGATAWNAKYSRDHETQSDIYGIKYMQKAGYDPQAAVELQELFVRMMEKQEPSWVEGLFASHPPSRDRVSANRAEVAKYPKGGTRNKDAFQRALAQLKKDKDAYTGYQDAIKAAKAKQYDKALSLVDNSIQQQPKENLFWELKGKLLLQKDQNKEAIPALDKAIAANPNFFRPYIYRGMAYKELGNRNFAERDLIASQKLLPTQEASEQLGDIALAKGDRGTARAYYEQVAAAGGEAGERAKVKLAQIQ